MKKNILQTLSLILLAFVAAGQTPYSLSLVPDTVKENANVIIQLDDTELEIESLDKATLDIHRVYTVMNEKGKDALFFNEYSSKDVALGDVEIKVYDVIGKQVGRYRKKEMSTIAVGEGLIEDGYVTYYPISTLTYPLTVEIKYEQKIRGTLNIPAFRYINVHEGVVEASYTARVPVNINLRYKAENTSIKPAVTNEGKSTVYKWTVKNLRPIEYEEGAASASSRYPHVKIVAEQFSYYGFKGDLSSWKSFGTWISNLYKGLDVLSPERQQFFAQLVQDAPNDREKIRRIYKYLQENFRYVSIQLGIGGLKPFSADFTDKKKYGDCKALSNFMKAALDAVGIQSYIAIINAFYNSPPVDPAFPSNDFDHVILCIPGSKDSIWLECTSSTAEFGQLGSFTENRNALLITENGGVLVPTPRSNSSKNILISYTTVAMDEDLSGETETVFTTTGEFRGMINEILKEKKDRQKEEIVFDLGFKQPDDFTFAKDASSSGRTRLKMILYKIPEFNAGTKWFIAPRIHKTWSHTLPKADNRKLDFYFPFPFERRDTTVFKLPAGITPDAMPVEKTLTCPYASYKSSYWYNEAEKSVYSASTLVLRQYKIAAIDYAQVKKFFDDLLQDDSQKIIVKKQATEKKGF